MGSSTSRRGFHGKRSILSSGAAQAAVTATSTNGVAAAAADLAALKAETEKIGDDARAAIVLLNEVRSALVDKGIFKGSA